MPYKISASPLFVAKSGTDFDLGDLGLNREDYSRSQKKRRPFRDDAFPNNKLINIKQSLYSI
jgi:hypothetical protein